MQTNTLSRVYVASAAADEMIRYALTNPKSEGQLTAKNE